MLILLPLYFLVVFSFLDKSYFLCPIACKRDYIIRNDARGDGFFFARRGNGSRLHAGIDLLADIGTPVMACRLGKVISATQTKGMGNHVIIRHMDGLVTVYGHLHQIFVRENQFVRQGEIIGSVGKTGNANYSDMQPHLHLELRKGGVPQDPFEYLE